MNTPVYISNRRLGYAHPRCFLAETNGCSEKISGEHYVSEALLNVIEKQNKTIDVSGLTWLPKEQLSSIGKANLKAKVLCTVHNSNLSPFDTNVANFAEAIGVIDAELQNDAPASLRFRIDGAYLERWAIKTVMGMVSSGQIQQRNGAPFRVKDKCFALLCSSEARWPRGWGLYLAEAAGQIFHSSSFELLPMHDERDGTLLAIGLKFNGISLNFLMGDPDSKGRAGIFRPAALRFKKGEVECEIALSWTGKSSGKAVTFLHTGTYAGPAPDQDLLRAGR